MSSTTPTKRRWTTLRIIRLATNIFIPIIVVVLFAVYNLYIYNYTFRYKLPVPKSAVIANVTLILTFLFIARVTDMVLDFSQDMSNAGLGDAALESGQVEDVAGRLWEHLEPHFTEMRKTDHALSGPHQPWASREDPGSHRANVDSPVSPPWPPRSNFIITNPDEESVSSTRAKAEEAARSRVQPGRDLSSHPKKPPRYPVVPVKTYIPFRPPKSRTPTPPRRPDPDSTHAPRFYGSYAPEQNTRSPYFEGYNGHSGADAATRSRYQQPNPLAESQPPDSHYPSKGAKSFADIVPPDQLRDHYDEENHDIQAFLACLPPLETPDSSLKDRKRAYPWKEPDYHKAHLDDKAYQQAKFEKSMRDRYKPRGWKEVDSGLRKFLMEMDAVQGRHRSPKEISDSPSDYVRYWILADKYFASRNRGFQSPSRPRGRRRERVVRKPSGSSCYADQSPRQTRVSPRFPTHNWNFGLDNTLTTARRAVEDEGRLDVAPDKRQDSVPIPMGYSKDGAYDRPRVAEVSPRTRVPGANDRAQKDRRTAEFDTFVKRCLSM